MWCVIRPGPNDIEHHGVRGQKHGERRYQNKDGSLTPLGRIHYGYGQRREGRLLGGPTVKDDDGPTVEGSGTSRYQKFQGKTKTASKRDYRDADDNTASSTSQSNTKQKKAKKPKDNRDNESMDGKWESVGGNGGNKKPPKGDNDSGSSGPGDSGGGKKKEKDPVTEKLKNKSKLYGAEEDLTKDLNKVLGKSINKATEKKKAKMDLSDLSDQDLRDYINRYNLEQQYKNIAVGNVATGRQKLQNVLEVAGGVLAVGASAATIASIIHEMRKG